LPAKQSKKPGSEPQEHSLDDLPVASGITEALDAASEVLEPDEIDGLPVKKNKSMRKQEKQLTSKEKQKVALGLRLMGMTYEQIGDRLEMSWQGAQSLCNRALANYTQDEARDLRNLQYARLEQMIMLHWPDVMRKDPHASAIVLGVMDRIAKMFGLEQQGPLKEGEQQEEGVLVIGGEKDQFIDGLNRARKALGGGTNFRSE
jgi:hypothetical protein